MKNTNLLLVLLFYTTGCNIIINDKLRFKKETERIEKCRENWNYKTNKTPIKIVIIEFHKKSHYTAHSFPNFFIGTTLKNDTIGIIEYDSTRNFKKGETVTFLPESKRNQMNGTNFRDYPIFTVSKKTKENDLICRLKTIYYGRIDENFED